MKKKKYSTPEMHLVKLDYDQAGTDLSGVSDDEILSILRKSHYAENKKMYRANHNYISRKIAGETILVPINSAEDELNGMISFNQAGELIWEYLQKRRTEADIIYLFAKKYEKDPCEVEADVKEFLHGALKKGFVIECE